MKSAAKFPAVACAALCLVGMAVQAANDTQAPLVQNVPSMPGAVSGADACGIGWHITCPRLWAGPMSYANPGGPAAFSMVCMRPPRQEPAL